MKLKPGFHKMLRNCKEWKLSVADNPTDDNLTL